MSDDQLLSVISLRPFPKIRIQARSIVFEGMAKNEADLGQCGSPKYLTFLIFLFNDSKYQNSVPGKRQIFRTGGETVLS